MNTITQNRTVVGVEKILTAAAEMESTSVAFASGLDLYFTRAIAPSNHFDRLQGGFNHFSMGVATMGLIILTLFLKEWSSWTLTKKAWQ